jgi:hypothetical protein
MEGPEENSDEIGNSCGSPHHRPFYFITDWHGADIQVINEDQIFKEVMLNVLIVRFVLKIHSVLFFSSRRMDHQGEK